MAPKKQIDSDEVMIVNDSPGEECRIAILQDGHLEELFTERTATATDVGNIYKGRVINVEPAIQAAFIDYGQGVNGFLHISDLHPKYFPGEERTERVGKKIPRRERPPIQHALRRGQEILVQVLKEGIGTKGPTLTSYLSIPGRLLVLMPDMDRVGVSRKVEDEEKRREMRQILDSLDLPDGFGFILRTAGYGKTKTELKRDAAYLLRLWKVMEKRIKTVGAPCELYTESDLLIRTVRDVLRPSIKSIVVDSPSAFERASTLLRVVSPRSGPKVIRYARQAPIFHAFDIERQIDLIHSREVPLPSGGRLVIDQTEALVAIDVNSGRSRSARDSETNAYETNCEAADEICRQLRLRDLGGLIVNDLIDMRSVKHRQQIEERFQNLLKRDRAKATVLKISEFGIMEMTRQRMRPSIRKSHFMACPHCNGRGEIKAADYVAADAVRHVGFLLQYPRVKRVEVACSPRVASVLLSRKRRDLVTMEDGFEGQKRVDVRVSEAIAIDRVDYYAYDDRNADIDITQLPPLTAPQLSELEAEALAAPAVEDIEVEETAAPQGRRRRKQGPADSAAIALAGDFDDLLDELEDVEEETVEAGEETPAPVPAETEAGEPRRGRRRRRRGRGGKGQPPSQAVPQPSQPEPVHAAGAEESETGSETASAKRSRRRRGRRRRRGEPHGDQTLIQPGLDNQPVSNGETIDATESVSGSEESPVRIHELARELSVSSREVIEAAAEAEADGAMHHIANALSTLSADEASSIRQMFSQTNGEGVSQESIDQSQTTPGAQGEAKRSRRRRRGGRGRRRRGQDGLPNQVQQPAPENVMQESVTTPESDLITAPPAEGLQSGQATRRSRRRRRRGGDQGNVMTEQSNANAPSAPQSSTPVQAQEANAAQPSAAPSPKKPRRALYRAGRVSVSPAARETASPDE